MHHRLSSRLALALLAGTVGMHHKPEGDPPASPPPPPAAPPPASPPAPPPPPPAPPELPADVKQKLDDYEKLKAAQEKADRDRMSETDKLKADLAQANADKLSAQRAAVGARAGLPKELAARLVGTTEAEMEADAAAIAKLLPPAAPPPPATSGTGAGGTPPPAPAAGELEKKREALAEAQKKGDRMAALKLSTEIQTLEAQATK